MPYWSRTSRFSLAFAAVGTVLLSPLAHASCKYVKCSPDVDAATTANVPVIIQYDHALSNAELSTIQTWGQFSRHMPSVHGVAISVPASNLMQIASTSGVNYVSLDRKLAARQQTAPIGTTPEFTAEPINAVWAQTQGYNGQNIGVAVIDSGITPTDDLGLKNKGANPHNRIVYSANFVPNETVTTDAYGHGTHVAGLIGGNGYDSLGNAYTRTFVGIAPGVNLINLRALDENGVGSDSSVIAAIEAAISLQSTYNIKVINLSLGRPIWESYQLDPLCQAVEQAWKAGIVVVVAAGNDGRDAALNPEGYGTINSPGNDPYVLTVGATNTVNTAALMDDVMASYSSKGPSLIDQISKPDIIAPGNLVTSLLSPGSNLQAANPTFYTPQSWYIAGGTSTASTTYFPLSGTSMATAVASGAVADLLQAKSYLTPDQVKALLMVNANKNVIPQTNVVTDPTVSGSSYTAHNDPFTQGAGYLDLQATINSALNLLTIVPYGYALSPTANYNSTTGTVTLVAATNSLWTSPTLLGQSWQAAAIYGQSSFSSVSGSTALWGKTALSAQNDPGAYTALWGKTALWGQGTPAASTALWGKAGDQGSSTNSGSTALWGK